MSMRNKGIIISVSTCKAVSGWGEEGFCICLTKLGEQTSNRGGRRRIYLHSTLLVCSSCSAGSASDALSACDTVFCQFMTCGKQACKVVFSPFHVQKAGLRQKQKNAHLLESICLYFLCTPRVQDIWLKAGYKVSISTLATTYPLSCPNVEGWPVPLRLNL